MDKHKIAFYNAQRKIKIDDDIKKAIRECILAALSHEGFRYASAIDITFVSADKIQEYNRKFRNVDAPTDVLSFPMCEFDDEGNIMGLTPDDEGLFLGDILICAQKAVDQSAEYGHSVIREMAFLSVHSTLHLLGFDHENEEERKTMRDKEETILESCGLER